MKALTLTQPWAALMADGRKSYETRSWYPHMLKRGDLLVITASKAMTPEDIALARDWGYQPTELPRGCVVAVVRFLEAHKTEHTTVTPEERSYGDFTPGRFAYRCELVAKLTTPVPCRGKQSIWVLPEDVERAVRAQMGVGV